MEYENENERSFDIAPFVGALPKTSATVTDVVCIVTQLSDKGSEQIMLLHGDTSYPRINGLLSYVQKLVDMQMEVEIANHMTKDIITEYFDDDEDDFL